MRPEVGFCSGVAVADDVFLQAALAAIKRRRGLIHGKYRNGGVCAIGALGTLLEKEERSILASEKIAEELMNMNDSVPKATRAERRELVIRWIEARLKAMQPESELDGTSTK